MFPKIGSFLLFVVIVQMSLVGISMADVEWSPQQTYKMENTPIDMAVSADGKYSFILTDAGQVLIYSFPQTLEETIDVGKAIRGIEASPTGDLLFLINGEDKSIQVLALEYIQQINILGSPFKGPADAPVVVAIFSDFQ